MSESVGFVQFTFDYPLISNKIDFEGQHDSHGLIIGLIYSKKIFIEKNGY